MLRRIESRVIPPLPCAGCRAAIFRYPSILRNLICPYNSRASLFVGKDFVDTQRWHLGHLVLIRQNYRGRRGSRRDRRARASSRPPPHPSAPGGTHQMSPGVGSGAGPSLQSATREDRRHLGFWFLSMKSSPRARPVRHFWGVGVGSVPGTRISTRESAPILDTADPPSGARACSSLYDTYLPVIALLLRDRCVLRSIHRSSSTRGKRTVRPRRSTGMLASSRAQRCTVRGNTCPVEP